MKTTQYSLTDFQSGCEGDWRNAVYIPCECCNKVCDLDRRGALMTAAPSGEPILIRADHYEKLTGQVVDPKECGCSISLDTFRTAFTRYLLWELDHAGQCPLLELDKKIKP